MWIFVLIVLVTLCHIPPSLYLKICLMVVICFINILIFICIVNSFLLCMAYNEVARPALALKMAVRCRGRDELGRNFRSRL